MNKHTNQRKVLFLLAILPHQLYTLYMQIMIKGQGDIYMKYRIFLSLVLFLALLAGCGPSSLQQEILGKWSGACNFNLGSNTSIVFRQIEFVSSGTAILDGYTADYSFIDNQRINLQSGIIGIALTVSINNNKLTLTDQSNESCLLNRVS